MSQGFRVLPVTLLAAWLLGCAPAAPPTASTPSTRDHGHDHDDHADHDHDHADHGHGGHEHPTTLAAGVVELEKTVREVGEKLAENGGEEADGAIHAAGHIVEDLRGLLEARKDLAEAEREAGTKALDDLFAAYERIDQAMHAEDADAVAGARKAHAEAKDTIEAAVKSLRRLFGGEAD